MTNNTTPSTRQGPNLHCLLGEALPASLYEDAGGALKLTPSAKENLWVVLQPAILEEMSQGLASGLSRFCQQYEIAEADLRRVIRICRYIVRQACAVNLPVDKLAEDVATVFERAPELAKMLVSEFDALKAVIRLELFYKSLANHGTVLEDVDWRLDRVSGCNDAPHLMIDVAMLTLKYGEDGQQKRLTLQVPLGALRKLHVITGGLLERQTPKPMRAAAE